MKTAKLIGILTTAAIALSLTACGTEKKATDTSLSEITLVLDWTPNTNHTGIYAADALGYYKDAGLKINIVQPPEDGAVAMTASGNAQFGIDFQDYLAPAFSAEEKMPVTAVAAILQHNTSGIISPSSAGIKSPAGLEGKHYATWGLPVEQAMIKYCMEKDGADFSKLELIPEDVMDVPTALQQGIDAVWVYYAWDGISTEKAGLDTNMFFFKDIVPEFDYYSPVIIANDKFLADEPDIAKAFLAATAKGYEYAVKNPKEAAELLCAAVPELDADMTAASQEWISAQYIADADRWGYIDPARWNAFYTWLYENKLYDKIEENTGFTNEYLPE